MRALVCTELTGLSGLSVQDLPSPPVGPSDVRIRVRAAGVNFADTLVIRGAYQEKPALPFVPGSEAAGEILEVGADVRAFAVGDPVVAMLRIGAFAEEAVAAVGRVHRLPAGVDFAVAAGFPVAYGTAHVALARRAGLRRDEVLVVHGAAGGVGLAAVEVGRALGARVIATASSDEKLAVVHGHGAHEVIHTGREDVKARVKELTGGKGADVIFDPVGGDLFDASVRCLATEGRLLTIGYASGRIPQVPANLLLVKNAVVIGVYWGAYLEKDPHVVHESLDQLLAMLGRGVLRPRVDSRVPLNEGGSAIATLGDRRAIGKVVIVL
ncbi:MAG: NADPH:quinone oxidoreductase family protein [Myxococcales bacterium]|nr:NADPH:quinone oxidoreductase family protein [Myxococcales bacterium]